ncbi:MAG TPA: hypothetical protein VNH46_08530 [Gemmatimonadales bacterium]|nr:hypothetical protein [Gemmatimonadales bacterium]
MRIQFAALTCLTLLAGCGSSGGTNGGSASTSFTGVVSAIDGTTTGALSFAIATASPDVGVPTGVALVQSSVTGTLKFNGLPAIQLTGTYESTTGALTLSGGGYSFTGTFDGQSSVQGTFTGPNGASGGFATTETSSSSTASNYCGSYARNDLSDAGTFSVVISGSSILGRWASSVDGSTGGLSGSVSGNNITINVSPAGTVATGTRSGTTISGTFTDPNSGGSGTWQGAVCQ